MRTETILIPLLIVATAVAVADRRRRRPPYTVALVVTGPSAISMPSSRPT